MQYSSDSHVIAKKRPQLLTGAHSTTPCGNRLNNTMPQPYVDERHLAPPLPHVTIRRTPCAEQRYRCKTLPCLTWPLLSVTLLARLNFAYTQNYRNLLRMTLPTHCTSRPSPNSLCPCLAVQNHTGLNFSSLHPRGAWQYFTITQLRQAMTCPGLQCHRFT